VIYQLTTIYNMSNYKSLYERNLQRMIKETSVDDMVYKMTIEEVDDFLVERDIPRNLDETAKRIITKKTMLLENVSDESFVWKTVGNNFSYDYFSEVQMFIYEGKIWMIGPYFINPKSPVTTVFTTYDITSGKIENLDIKLDSNVYEIFKRYYYGFVYNDIYYIIYRSEGKNGTPDHLKLDRFDLRTHKWESDVKILYDPIMDEDPYEGYMIGTVSTYLLENKLYMILSTKPDYRLTKSVIMKLDLDELYMTSEKEMERIEPSLSRIVYKNYFISFTNECKELKMIDFQNDFQVTTHRIESLANFNLSRHSHHMKLYNDDIILLRQHDGFKFNVFNLKEMTWGEIKCKGEKPSNVRTEGSVILHGDTIYVHHSTDTKCKNKISCIKIESNESNDNSAYETKMFRDGYEDAIIVIGEKEIPVHRSLLASRYKYFEDVFKDVCGDCAKDVYGKILISGGNISYDVLLIVIRFIYKFNVDGVFVGMGNVLNMELIEEAYIMCYDFGIDDMLRYLEKLLTSRLNIKNVLYIYKRYHAIPSFSSRYMLQIEDFIRNNRKEIGRDPSFVRYCAENPEFIAKCFSL